MAQLRGWAEYKIRKPLVLRGARHVGKTTLMEEFGKESDSFISLNLLFYYVGQLDRVLEHVE